MLSVIFPLPKRISFDVRRSVRDMADPVKTDHRRALLKLPQHGPTTAEAIRAAYWRIVTLHHPSKGGSLSDFDQVRQANRELLAEVGVRIPPARRGKR
jgi:hypothetical protein